MCELTYLLPIAIFFGESSLFEMNHSTLLFLCVFVCVFSFFLDPYSLFDITPLVITRDRRLVRERDEVLLFRTYITQPFLCVASLSSLSELSKFRPPSAQASDD